jgi:hypothetical protein
MRIRVEVGRTRVRTATKVIVGVVIAAVVFLAIANRDYLAVYDSAGGQIMLAIVGGIFALGGWLLTRMADIELPERFTARSGDPARIGGRAVNAVVMVLLGAGVGIGVLITWRALAPRPPSIDSVLAGPGPLRHRDRRPLPAGPLAIGPVGTSARRLIEALGYDADRHPQELELVGRTPERHAFDKLLGAVAGLLVPNLAGAALV